MASLHRALVLACSFVSVSFAVADERFDSLVREDFFAGLQGDTNRLERAMRRAEAMLAPDPTLRGTVYESKARAWLAGRPEAATREFFQCSGCHMGESSSELRPD
jgi:hypothetical protein